MKDIKLKFEANKFKIFAKHTRKFITCTKMDDKIYDKIQTFLFFDLETSDLIKGKKFPRTTELSMVGVSRDSIKVDQRDKLALPRIMHKLTLVINPMVPINAQASHASNLWNDTLEQFKSFDESTSELILQFIDRLPTPLCFVAHNGNNFDYPIFLSELDRVKKTLPDSILCIDTLKAFHEFYDMPEAINPINNVPEAGLDEVDEELENFKLNKADSSLDDEWNRALAELDDIENGSLKCKSKDEVDSIRKSNDCKTPKNSYVCMQAKNEKTPESQMFREKIEITEKFVNARKKLKYGDQKPKNFKLLTLYMHLTGREAENLHSAEGDCISMLRCVNQLGPHFVEWADYNAVSLNLFKK